MKQVIFEILSNEALTADVYRMVLGGDTSGITKAGQFVEIALPGKFLRRPISVNDWEPGKLTIIYKVVGHGTEQMSALPAGTRLDVLTGLGNGYDTTLCGDNPVLVGGGVGVPPLLQTAYAAKEKGLHVTVAVGYRDALFLEQEFRAAADAFHFATDDGSAGFHGNAVQLIETLALSEGTVVLACGPKPMLRALQRFCMERTLPLQVSLEERMGCGYGACVGCVCKLRQNGAILQKRVCKDGPVFDGSEVIFE